LGHLEATLEIYRGGEKPVATADGDTGELLQGGAWVSTKGLIIVVRHQLDTGARGSCWVRARTQGSAVARIIAFQQEGLAVSEPMAPNAAIRLHSS
jgi:hypothetical protein